MSVESVAADTCTRPNNPLCCLAVGHRDSSWISGCFDEGEPLEALCPVTSGLAPMSSACSTQFSNTAFPRSTSYDSSRRSSPSSRRSSSQCWRGLRNDDVGETDRVARDLDGGGDDAMSWLSEGGSEEDLVSEGSSSPSSRREETSYAGGERARRNSGHFDFCISEALDMQIKVQLDSMADEALGDQRTFRPNGCWQQELGHCADSASHNGMHVWIEASRGEERRRHHPGHEYDQDDDDDDDDEDDELDDKESLKLRAWQLLFGDVGCQTPLRRGRGRSAPPDQRIERKMSVVEYGWHTDGNEGGWASSVSLSPRRRRRSSSHGCALDGVPVEEKSIESGDDATMGWQKRGRLPQGCWPLRPKRRWQSPNSSSRSPTDNASAPSKGGDNCCETLTSTSKDCDAVGQLRTFSEGVAKKGFSGHHIHLFENERAIYELLRRSTWKHPNVAQTLGFDDKNKKVLLRPYDSDLRQFLNGTVDPLLPDALKAAMRQIFAGLKACQSSSIIHGNIKPENLLISKDWTSIAEARNTRHPHQSATLRVMLSDFEHAIVLRSGEPSRNVGRPFGSPKYLPPESRTYPYVASVSTDIWAAGVVMAELMFGSSVLECCTPLPSLPSSAPSTSPASVFCRSGWDAVNLRMTEKGLNEDAVDLLRKCLQRDPERRLSIDEALDHKWFH